MIQWWHGSRGMDFAKLVQYFQFRRHHRRFVVHGCLAPFGNQDPAGCQPPNNHREVWKEFFRSPELVRVIDPSADVAKQPVTPAERFFVNMVSRSLVQGFNARMIRGNLTLALSPGEREPPSAGCGVAMGGAAHSDCRRARSLRPILPLPEGEGRGEGEAVAGTDGFIPPGLGVRKFARRAGRL